MKVYQNYKDVNSAFLQKIPESWCLKKISHGFNKIGSGTTPSSNLEEYYLNGEHNWLQTGDLNDNDVVATSKKITKKALQDYSTLRLYPVNSLVIAMYGATIGKVCILKIPSTTNQACCVLSNAVDILPEYAFYWFLANKPTIVAMGYGGGQPNISQEIIRSLRIPCPSIEEQNKIISFLRFKDRWINHKEASPHQPPSGRTDGSHQSGSHERIEPECADEGLRDRVVG